MQPKVIRTDEEHEAALKQIEALWDAEPGTPEGDEFELWAILIEMYEDEHYPIVAPDPISYLHFLMDQGSLRQADLIPYIGSRSKVSEVLSGKRSLSLSMIRALHEGLDIPADVLIQKPMKQIPKPKSKNRKTALARKSTIAAKTLRKSAAK
jgi:HTH-type transcriptional regulator/antitoxin HigA